MKPTLLVLAAGMGSRYGGLKQLDPVGPSGEVILDFSVYDAKRAGFSKVVFVIRRELEEAFRSQICSRYREEIEVDTVFQELDDLPDGHRPPPERSKPWGTVQAMLAAREVIQEPFGVINADDFYGPESFRLLAEALRELNPGRPDAVLVAFTLNRTISEHGTVSRGVCEVDDSGHLVSVEECHEIAAAEGGIRVRRAHGGEEVVDGTQAVSMNTWGFTPAVFKKAMSGFSEFLKNPEDPLKSEYYIPTLIQQGIDAGECRVQVLKSPEQWLGVTYPEDKPAVVDGLKERVRDGLYPNPLWGAE